MITWPVAQGVAAAVGFIAMAVKLRDLRADPSNPILRRIVAAILAATTAVVLSMSFVYTHLDGLVGVRNLAYWLLHAVALYGVYQVQVVALLFTRPDKARAGVRLRRLAWLLTVVVMGVLVVAGSVPEAPSLSHPSSRLAAFELLWAAFLVFSFTDLARMCLRYVPHTAGQMVHSLKLIALGAALVDGYAVLRAIHVGATLAGSGGLPGLFALEGALMGMAMVVLVAGVTWSAWWSHLDTVVRHLRCYRSWRALSPLWTDIHRSHPEIALTPASRLWPVLAGGDAPFRLYRRVIEIHDGMLVLRELLSAHDESTARRQATELGLQGDQIDVAVTASLLRLALERETAGSAHSGGAAGLRFPAVPPGLDDLESEARWLAAVAAAYRATLSAGSLARSPRTAEVFGA